MAALQKKLYHRAYTVLYSRQEPKCLHACITSNIWSIHRYIHPYLQYISVQATSNEEKISNSLYSDYKYKKEQD